MPTFRRTRSQKNFSDDGAAFTSTGNSVGFTPLIRSAKGYQSTRQKMKSFQSSKNNLKNRSNSSIKRKSRNKKSNSSDNVRVQSKYEHFHKNSDGTNTQRNYGGFRERAVGKVRPNSNGNRCTKKTKRPSSATGGGRTLSAQRKPQTARSRLSKNQSCNQTNLKIGDNRQRPSSGNGRYERNSLHNRARSVASKFSNQSHDRIGGSLLDRLTLKGSNAFSDGQRTGKALSTKLFAKLSKRMSREPTVNLATTASLSAPLYTRQVIHGDDELAMDVIKRMQRASSGKNTTSSSSINLDEHIETILKRNCAPTPETVTRGADEREKELRERLEHKGQEVQRLHNTQTTPKMSQLRQRLQQRMKSQQQQLHQTSYSPLLPDCSPGNYKVSTQYADDDPLWVGVRGTRKQLKVITRLRKRCGPAPGSAAARRAQKQRVRRNILQKLPNRESPKSKRLRLRKKVVAVMDKIRAAGVPIVAAGACQNGNPRRVISDKKERCTIQVGYLCPSEGGTEKTMCEVVLKNQIVSSDQNDFVEVLDDFCIECATGWAVSKFKDYWEASFENNNDEEESSCDESENIIGAHPSKKRDNVFLQLAHGLDNEDNEGVHSNNREYKYSSATVTMQLLAQYLMGCDSETLITLIQHAKRWSKSLVPAAQKTRINTTFAAAIERRDDMSSDPDVQAYNLIIVMQFSTPAFPPGYSESETRLSMDLTDWIQADSYWRCIREAQVDTGERAPSRISFVDDEGNTFIYSMDVSMKNHLCMELGRTLVELWRTGYLHCDIKPANFIVCKNAHRKRSQKRTSNNVFISGNYAKDVTLKLIDFGEGGLKSEVQGIIAGTDWYMAPEMKEYGAPSIQSEVYSCGVSMVEIWCGELWDTSRSAEDCLTDAINTISRRNTIVGQFLQRCLAKEPDARPFPYDLYTFFSSQCQSLGCIYIGPDPTLLPTGERQTLEQQAQKLNEEDERERQREEAQEANVE